MDAEQRTADNGVIVGAEKELGGHSGPPEGRSWQLGHMGAVELERRGRILDIFGGQVG